jgi:phosphonate transport system substrate-binding protein
LTKTIIQKLENQGFKVCLKNVFSFYGQKLTILFQKLTIVTLAFATLYLYGGDKNKLILGLTGVVLKEDIATIVKLKLFLEKKINLPIAFKFIKSYAGMKSMLLNGSVDFAYICGPTYVDLKPSGQVKLLVLPTVAKKPYYNSLIIVRKKSPYKSIFDLKNRVFALSDPESNSASLVPRYMIYKKGYDFNKFFKKIIITYDHGESIEAVLSGYVDGASVDGVVYRAFKYKNPKKAQKLKIVNRFGYYPIPPFVVRADIDENTKNELVNAFTNMKKDKEGKKILKSLAIDGFIKPGNISYKKIELIKQYLRKKENSDDR